MTSDQRTWEEAAAALGQQAHQRAPIWTDLDRLIDEVQLTDWQKEALGLLAQQTSGGYRSVPAVARGTRHRGAGFDRVVLDERIVGRPYRLPAGVSIRGHGLTTYLGRRGVKVVLPMGLQWAGWSCVGGEWVPR